VPLESELPGLVAFCWRALDCRGRSAHGGGSLIFGARGKATSMVALATPRFGYIVEPNLARTFLHRALLAQEAGNLLQAGVLFREAVRRQLYAECSWKACLPAGKKAHLSPRALLAALVKAGHVSKDGAEWARELIELGNRAAHCGRVDAKELRSAIAIWHTAIDNDPCGEPKERVDHCKPVTDGYDIDVCDDDDGADLWKGGAI
jgi:hypothetical protein